MARFNIKKLPRQYPRAYLPDNLDLLNLAELGKIFTELLARPVESLRQLKQWLRDRDEFQACFGQEGSGRFIQFSTAVDNPKYKAAQEEFQQVIMPAVSARWNELDKKYFASPARKKLPRKMYGLYDRAVSTELKLFRKENIPLQKKVAKLAATYQERTGMLTIRFKGKTFAPPQLSPYLQMPERKTRAAAWKALANGYKKHAKEFESLFSRLFRLRHKIAQNANCKDFMAYTFKDMGRFDYTPADCRRFHTAIEKEIVPLVRTINERRREQLGVKTLRPWDLPCDPQGLPALKPFTSMKSFVDKTQKIFNRVDGELGGYFETMVENNLLDLASRKGKAPGGYQATLSECRLPFIFMNAVGIDRDVRVLLHEGGHAFHAMLSRDIEVAGSRQATLEFCEVASMAMELIGYTYIDEFYPQSVDAERSRREHLEGIVSFFPWMARIDAFQHWLYTHPQHTTAQRRKCWAELAERFDTGVDWRGLEQFSDTFWHRQLHVFRMPFYYVEYGIAQLGALQIWQNYQQDKTRGIALYKKALAQGGLLILPELFRTAGISFDLSRKKVRELMQHVCQDRVLKLVT